VAMLSLSIMSGMTPWGGPATRAIAALGLDAGEYFIPSLPTMVGSDGMKYSPASSPSAAIARVAGPPHGVMPLMMLNDSIAT
ncbi:hypothetical protein QCD79_31145, partial [Pseudomonas quasicaspiana]|nr:hypothetical protein [Pseudomonas quasicaspiana]